MTNQQQLVGVALIALLVANLFFGKNSSRARAATTALFTGPADNPGFVAVPAVAATSSNAGGVPPAAVPTLGPPSGGYQL